MKDLTIHNFRCYTEKHIEFRSGINLLIGNNSSGKTSLIRACNFVNNAFFCGYSDENTNWKSVDENDFKLYVGEGNTILPSKTISINFHAAPWDFTDIIEPDGASTSFDYDTELKIEKNSSKNSRNLITGLNPLKEYGMLLNSCSHMVRESGIEQLNVLPVYACFTTEDIHSSRKIDVGKFKEYAQKPSFGYYECYDCRGLFDYWLNRLLVLQEAETGVTEINTVRKAIKSALGEEGCNIINDIIIRPMRGKVFFKYTDGRIVESGMLSDGYKRLVNIVLDIAIRCSLLNKIKFGEESFSFTHGTVIIDEIDEHLHPALQSRVLKDLHRTFPKIQFIVSTHAPMVISSVENSDENVVYQLWYDVEEKTYRHSELNTYGLDSNLILEENMGVDSRDSAVQEQFVLLKNLVKERRLAEALKMLDSMNRPDQPELVKLRSMINRLMSRI